MTQSGLNKKKEFASLIKDDDKIAAQSGLIPNLSSRRYIYPIGYAYFGSGQFAYNKFDLPQLDKILIDFDDFMAIMVERETGPLLQDSKFEMPGHFRSALSDYNLIKAQNNYFLWEHKDKALENLLIYEVEDKPDNFVSQDFLLENKKVPNNNQLALKLSFQKNKLANKDYIVRFYRDDYYYDIPLDYGLLPEYEWDDDKIYSFYYFPDKTVDGFEVFSWQGENKLGHIREIVPDLELQSVVSRIDL